MTGFGMASRPWASPEGPVQVEVEARSVNARFLELKLRHPFGLLVEQNLRGKVESRLGRGRVELSIYVRRGAAAHPGGASLGSFGLDVERVRDAVAALKIVDEISVEQKLELSRPNAADVLEF